MIMNIFRLNLFTFLVVYKGFILANASTGQALPTLPMTTETTNPWWIDWGESDHIYVSRAGGFGTQRLCSEDDYEWWGECSPDVTIQYVLVADGIKELTAGFSNFNIGYGHGGDQKIQFVSGNLCHLTILHG